MQKLALGAVALLFLLPNFFKDDLIKDASYNLRERYEPALGYITSIDKLQAHTDSIAAASHIAPNSFEYVQLLENVISRRFYHGFSHYSLNENWMAAVSGALLKEDYACKVQPEHIIQHANAACSQQSLVMMQVLRNKGLHHRKLGFPHHYALEVMINHNWYFFDPNMEPEMTKDDRLLSRWNHRNDYLKQFYDPKRCTKLDFQFGDGLTAIVGPTDEVPARNARLFHGITGIASKTMWLLPLCFLLMPIRLVSKRKFGIKLPTLQWQPRYSLSV